MIVRRTIRTRLAATLLGAGLAVTATSAVAAPDDRRAEPPAAVTVTSAVAAPADRRAEPPAPVTATVPADLLGPDSVVAVVTHGDIERLGARDLARSLEVITPDGARHPVWSVGIRESRDGWFLGDFLLADWRPELHAALLRVSRGADTDLLVSYDVTTGATQQVVAPRRLSTVALDPDGSGVLFTTYPGQRRPGIASALTWAGERSDFRARADGAAITSTDGLILVTDDSEGRKWWITDLTTGTSRSVGTPGACRPHRWLDADSVLATCSTRRASQLLRVDLDGASARMGLRHTERTRAAGPDVFDDDDVRVVQGRSWYESYGACGGAFLTRQTANGRVRMVQVPGRDGALSLIGPRADRLVLAHQADDCASGRSRAVLTIFDPVARQETVLTLLDRSEAWREVVPATEVQAWIW
jgi:hypothetical protein